MMRREKPADLLTNWKLEQLAYERALGQILQHLVFVYQELDAEKLEKRLLKQTVSQLEKRLVQLGVRTCTRSNTRNAQLFRYFALHQRSGQAQ